MVAQFKTEYWLNSSGQVAQSGADYSWGVRDNPSHSQCISFRVTFWSSSGVSGQRKQFLSSLFIRIQKPDPSH